MPDKQYKIVGLSYSKPSKFIDAKGEVCYARFTVLVSVGLHFELVANNSRRKVTRIEYQDLEKQFYIYFDDTDKTFKKKGLLTIPLLGDTEVFYEEV